MPLSSSNTESGPAKSPQRLKVSNRGASPLAGSSATTWCMWFPGIYKYVPFNIRSQAALPFVLLMLIKSLLMFQRQAQKTENLTPPARGRRTKLTEYGTASASLTSLSWTVLHSGHERSLRRTRLLIAHVEHLPRERSSGHETRNTRNNSRSKACCKVLEMMADTC